MAKDKTVDIPMLTKFEDTPYITQARQMSQLGGEKMMGLHDKLNVFSEPTQQSLQARVNDMYRKSELDYQRQYRDASNKINQANYRRFGTLNATPAAYAGNLQELQHQDHLARMAQQKAQSYDQVVNNELQRRYNTFNMYKSLYGLGDTPLNIDLKNWDIHHQNQDRQYANDLAAAASGTNWAKVGLGALSGAASGFLMGGPVGAVVGGVGGAAGGF